MFGALKSFKNVTFLKLVLGLILSNYRSLLILVHAAILLESKRLFIFVD
jgi:hypothetical protein